MPQPPAVVLSPPISSATTWQAVLRTKLLLLLQELGLLSRGSACAHVSLLAIHTAVDVPQMLCTGALAGPSSTLAVLLLQRVCAAAASQLLQPASGNAAQRGVALPGVLLVVLLLQDPYCGGPHSAGSAAACGVAAPSMRSTCC